MTELQKKMLEMLCELDEICQKHNIEYCLFAGTALGADRHHGFIPWDDDADIIMTLENYEKLLSVFDSEAKENRVLNCLENTPDYPFTYARYVDTATTAIQRHTAFGGCDPGIKIDIFVVVPTHDKIEKAEKHRLEILAFSEVICPYAIMHHYRPEGYHAVLKAERKLFDRVGRERYLRKRMDKLKYYKKKGTGKYILFAGMMSNSYILDADIMDEIEYVPFEYTMLPVSKNNKKFSTQLYGESWISKPQNVDVPRHTFLLDMEKPYKEYLDILWQENDYCEIENIAASRRNMHLFERDEFKDVLINNQKLRNLAVELGTNELYGKLPHEMREKWDVLYNLFSDYYNAQIKSINKHYGLFIDLNIQAFESAMMAAIMMDRYYEAADIINLGIKAGVLNAVDDRVCKLLELTKLCKVVTETLYLEKDFDKLRNVLKEANDSQTVKPLTLIIAELWINVIEADRGEELQEIIKNVERFTDDFMESGELLIIKAYCLEKCGDCKKAASAFVDAAKNIRNGLVYQYLVDKGFSAYEND